VPVELSLTPSQHGTLNVYPIEFARHFGVRAFVTDRNGGVSPAPYESLNLGDHVNDDPANVAENRRRVAEAIGVGADRLVIINQVHGRDVVNANEATPESSGDVIIDYGDEYAIAVLVADCLPILLVDEDSPTLAVVHAGWRGLQSNVLESALEHFEHHNAVHAFVGPSISGAAYQVGPEVAQNFTSVPGALTPDTGDRSRLDLRAVAVSQLLALNVTDNHITVASHSTDGGLTFFSDRAQRPCGRFGLVARRVIA
jgi:purine-nucleoside/S-methyl-5'-thioadenosine phosphorylase / adenosine deaminase